MAKRKQRGSPTPPRTRPEPKSAWPQERHSGEGSASALETLQKLESRRQLGTKPPAADEDPKP